MENLLIQIVSILLQSLFVSYYFISICNYQKNKKSTFIFTFLCTLSASIITSIFNLKQYNTLLNTIFLGSLFILIIKFVLNKSLLKSILILLSYYLLMAITEISSYYILNFTIGLSPENILNTPILLTLLITIQHIIATIITLILKNYIMQKLRVKNLTIKNLILLLLMIIGYILPQIVAFPFTGYHYPLSLLIINAIQMILVSILIFLYFKSTINKEKIESDLANTELHNKTLIEIVDSIKTLKHDYGNIIQALNGYVTTKQYDRLNEYVNSLLKEFNNVNNLSSIDPKIFNDPAIYGVVGAKYFYANENNIIFEIDITSNIKKINFSMPDLSRIFGILLDNAIEATKKAKNKYIRLEIHFNDKKYADVIRIINTYDTSINIDLDKIYEKGVSSKKVKSGIGLWEVKKLVNKNGHSQIYATIEKDKFVQNLIIEKID